MTAPSRRPSSRILWAAFGVLWLGSVVAGLGWLASYANTPGAPAHAPTRWPVASVLARDTTRPTLIMLAHPRCVCTRASLTELAELMARTPHRPKAFIIFIKPGGVGQEWENTELWQLASQIPDASLVRDDAGRESDRFGAETSGQVLLYDETGRLIFAGGDTGSRGHPGDNIGRETILALLNHDPRVPPSVAAATPVYGCPLFNDQDRRAARTNNAAQSN